MESSGVPLIRVKNLHKTFGKQRVLDGISFSVLRGESLAILGRSGTGKSVLLKLLVGLLKPEEGVIEILGHDIAQLADLELNSVRKKMGFLFQAAALYDSLTVADNVAFPLRRHHTLSAGERRRRVFDLLARVGMEGAAEKLPAEISGGMKKRVGLARALALDPEILLLDEPTSGLDPVTAAEINDLIRELQDERDISAVVVTHDMHTVKDVSDRVAMLHEGKVILQGDFQDLENSDHPFVSEFLRQSF